MPTSVTAGEAFIKVTAKGVANTSRSIRDLERMMVRSFGTMTRYVTKFGIALGAISTGVLVDFTRRAMNAEETWQKFGVVFGEQASNMTMWVDKMSQGLGRSREETARMVSEAQDLFIPLGFSADAAERMSKIVTRLSLDLASFNNRKDADAFRDVTAALTGSTETMKKYGSIVTWAAIKQEALNMGLDPTKITETQKAWLRLKVMIDTTQMAQGDLLRTQNSTVNTLKTLGAAYQDMAVRIGTQLLPYVDWFARVLTHIANIIGPVFETWLSNTNQNMVALGNTVKKVTVFVLDMTNAFAAAVIMLQDMATGVSSYEEAAQISQRRALVKKYNKTSDPAKSAELKAKIDAKNEYIKELETFRTGVEAQKESAKEFRRVVETMREIVDNADPVKLANAPGLRPTHIPGVPGYRDLLPGMPDMSSARAGAGEAEATLKKIEQHTAKAAGSNELDIWKSFDNMLADNNKVLNSIDDRLRVFNLKPPVKLEKR